MHREIGLNVLWTLLGEQSSRTESVYLEPPENGTKANGCIFSALPGRNLSGMYSCVIMFVLS